MVSKGGAQGATKRVMDISQRDVVSRGRKGCFSADNNLWAVEDLGGDASAGANVSEMEAVVFERDNRWEGRGVVEERVVVREGKDIWYTVTCVDNWDPLFQISFSSNDIELVRVNRRRCSDARRKWE